MLSRFTPVMVLCAAAIFSACGAPTEMLTSWDNPDYESIAFRHVVVLGMSNNLDARKTVEEDVAEQLRERGIRAEASMRVFPVGFFSKQPEKEAVRAYLIERGVDGVLVVSVLDIKEKTSYVPDQTTYRPSTQYQHFHGYWSTVYEQVNTPGYMSTSRDIYLESNLYDVETTDLLWSAQSVTANPQSIDELARSFGKAMVGRMIEEGALRP